MEMQAPTWLKPAIMGAIAGGIATMIVGFNYGGWYLGSSAEKLAQKHQAALAQRFDDEPLAVTVHDSLISGQFELDRDANRLIASIAEKSTCLSRTLKTIPDVELPDFLCGRGHSAILR
jgi:hypothetical protein